MSYGASQPMVGTPSKRAAQGMSAQHLQFLRGLSCCCCRVAPAGGGGDVYHLRNAPGGTRGTAQRAPDCWAVPMCELHRRAAERSPDERVFFAQRGLDPVVMARRLWRRTGQQEAGEAVVRALYTIG
jgi:hypothetical protein